MIKFKLYRFQVQLWHIGNVVHDGPTASKLLKVRILFYRGCKCNVILLTWTLVCTDQSPAKIWE